MTKILYVVNDAWFFASHRLALATNVISKGMSATLVAHEDSSVPTIEQHGVVFRPWCLSPRGKSLVGELRALWQLARIVLLEKPDIVQLVTIKPVLYGGLICRVFGTPAVVYAISGLGAILESPAPRERFLRAIIRPLYGFAMGHRNSVVVFQNADNRDALISYLKRPKLNSKIIRGSGVQLKNFTNLKPAQGIITYTLAARLLKDKGITEFVDASRLLIERGIIARFIVAGDMAGRGNPAAYTQEEIKLLVDTSTVEFVGYTKNIPQLFAQTNVVVLPSYHEGLPKVLVEAGAAARAVITTDIPGCRDAIKPGVSGLLVPAMEVQALADAMYSLAMDSEKCIRLGLAGRELVESELREEIISEQHYEIYNELLMRSKNS